MVMSCAAYGCTSRVKAGAKISFHGFPINPELCKQWLIAMKRKDFIPSKYSKLCSEHFTPDDFIINFGRKELKPNTVPSIFKFSEHLVEIAPKEELESTCVQLKQEECTATSREVVFLDAAHIQLIQSPESITFFDTKQQPDPLEDATGKSIVQVKQEDCSTEVSTEISFVNTAFTQSPEILPFHDIGQQVDPLECITEKSACAHLNPEHRTSSKELIFLNTTTQTQSGQPTEILILPNTTQQLLHLERVTWKRRRSQPVYFGDVLPQDLENPQNFKRLWEIAEKTISRHKKTIIYLRTKMRRLQKKVESLNGLIDHLKDNNKISSSGHTFLQPIAVKNGRKNLLR